MMNIAPTQTGDGSQEEGTFRVLEIDIDWRRIASFRGRIGRRAFWKLACLPVLLVAGIMWWSLLNAPDGGEAYDTLFFSGMALSAIGAYFGVRRLHDMDRSGWWALILVLPFVLAWFPIVNNVLLVTPLIMAGMFGVFSIGRGTWGANTYGDPGNGSPFPNDHRFPG
jgi:uncharacterized membrane protein YhaH (DUF805 family)